MKPLHLSMTAFGPYKNTEKVDFTAIPSGLYLIYGDTGAGKTTIFDAICYALYGQNSDSSRPLSAVRSQYADDDIKTEVTLEFECNGRTYKITRSPTQWIKGRRRGKRDDGLIKSMGEAILSGESLDKDLFGGEANKKIEEIVGLSLTQFRQTTMIAQGQFRELINSDTKARQTLFRTIMNSAPIDKFCHDLEDEAKTLSTQIEKDNVAFSSTIHGYSPIDESLIEEIRSEDPHELAINVLPKLIADLEAGEKERSSLKSAATTANKEKEEAAKRLEDAKANNENLTKFEENHRLYLEIAKDEKNYEEKAASLGKAKEASRVLLYSKNNEETCKRERSAIEALEKATKQKKDFGPTLEAANKAFEEEMPKLKQEKANGLIAQKELKDKLGLFKSLDECQKEMNSCAKDLEDIANQLKALTEENDKKSARIMTIENKYRDDDLALKKSQLEVSIKDVSALEQKSENLIKSLETIKITLRDIWAKETTYKQKSAAFAEIKAEYEEMKDEYLHDTAYLLSSTLEEGMPCPVCGSTSHPKPASKSTKGVNREELNAKKTDMDKAEKDLLDEHESLVSDNKVLQERLSSLLSSYEELFGQTVTKDTIETELKAQLHSLANDRSRILEDLKKVETALKQKEADLKEKDRLRLEIERSSSLIKDLDAKREDLNARALTKKEMTMTISNSIGETSFDKVEKDIADLETRLLAIDSRLRTIEDNHLEAVRRDSNFKATEESAKKALEDARLAKKEAALQLQAAIEASSFQNIEEAEASNILSQSEISAREKDIENYRVNLKSRKQSEKEFIDAGFDKLSPIDLGPLQENLLEVSTKRDELIGQYHRLDQKISANRDILQRANNVLESKKKSIEWADKVQRLAKIASGKAVGQKFNFEVYYQRQIFLRIIERASRKLEKMSEGEFSLFPRSLDSDDNKGNAQIGLDIDVFDSHTGQRRDIKTLSGGEQFKAALALALSFSEIITERHGYIEIDCLFVDEGFGSLDQKSLPEVITLLRGLSSGQRQVGIISHIEALREAIQTQLYVRKDENGSHIEIKV